MKESDCRKRQSLFLQMGGDEMQILLVEDDAVIMSGLVYALEQEGYSVCHAETVAAALGVNEYAVLGLLASLVSTVSIVFSGLIVAFHIL